VNDAQTNAGNGPAEPVKPAPTSNQPQATSTPGIGSGSLRTIIILSVLCALLVGLIAGYLIADRDDKAGDSDSTPNGSGQVGFDALLPIEQLETGECLNASNLTDDSEDFVEDIEEVSCDGPHDAEVLVTKKLTQDEAEDYDPASSTMCTDLITEGGLSEKVGPEIGYFGLTTDAAPNAGDQLVCIAYELDGTKLDAPL
jgi:hypothetical protein